mmetsp:Transcript_42702/g.128162  ORF Transcript_42702/g.128162 Transcript_42702/m.128162 type:complete len:447 (+) Transcript_42702:3348-4688(+)
MDAASALHAEVAPHFGRRPEAELVDTAAGGLEATVGVLSGDAHSKHMTVWRLLRCRLEVKLRGAAWVLAIERPDGRHAPQRDAHGHHELARWDVHTCDALSHGVLHLQAWVELQETVLLPVHQVEVLHRRGAHIADGAGERACASLHVRQFCLRGARHRPLLDDLLVAALDAAITALQRRDVAVHVAKKLHLQVAADGRELHSEDGAAGNLSLHLLEHGHNLVIRVHLADALSAAAPAGLEHHRVANLAARLHRLVHTVDACLLVDLVWDGATALGEAHRHAGAAPRKCGHARRLRQYGAADLVAQCGHRHRPGTQEADAVFLESCRELRILTGVTPARPHRVAAGARRHLDDERHICVVVVVGSAGHLDKLVAHLDVLRVDADVVGGGHGNQRNGLRVPEGRGGPRAHRAHKLDSSEAVVGHQDTVDRLVATHVCHELVQLLLHA